MSFTFFNNNLFRWWHLFIITMLSSENFQPFSLRAWHTSVNTISMNEWMATTFFLKWRNSVPSQKKKKINKNNCNCWKILHSNLQKRYAFFRNNYFLYEQVFHYGFVYKIVVVCNFSVYKLIGWVFFVVYLVIIDQSPKTWRCFI